MSNAFQQGDVVVCVDAAPPFPMCWRQRAVLGRIKRGGIYRVGRVFVLGEKLGIELNGVDHAPTRGWHASRFRKIEAADEDFAVAVKQLIFQGVGA